MREAPLEHNQPAVAFARDVIDGKIDIVIFMTGVGFQHFLEAVCPAVDQAALLAALAKIVTVARGPKPVAAMKEAGLAPTHRVPEPNTWRELLDTLDQHAPPANQRVGLQEYGQPNPHLVAGLEARGASVVAVQVYRWVLPSDTSALEANVRAIAGGQRDVALFTSGHQVVNLLSLAERLALIEEVRQAFRQLVVASIGPTTSEMLREQDLPVDLAPEHPKMGQLVAAAASQAGTLLQRKRRVTTTIEAAQTDAAPRTRHRSEDGPFMKACRREPTDVTPIWLMRQAGRYLPEYREIREKTTFLELCKNPDLCAEVMIRTVERLGVDAAIIFSDLLPILEPMGMDLEFARGEGPQIHNPVRQAGDIDRVLELESVDSLDFVMQTVRATRAGLRESIPVIGFAGRRSRWPVT